MFVLGNLVIALAKLTNAVVGFLNILIIARALVSWVSPDPYNPIVQFLYRTTDPMLEPIRRVLPRMAVDFSPLVAILLLQLLQWFLVPTLYDLGMRLH